MLEACAPSTSCPPSGSHNLRATICCPSPLLALLFLAFWRNALGQGFIESLFNEQRLPDSPELPSGRRRIAVLQGLPQTSFGVRAEARPRDGVVLIFEGREPG